MGGSERLPCRPSLNWTGLRQEEKFSYSIQVNFLSNDLKFFSSTMLHGIDFICLGLFIQYLLFPLLELWLD